jgi:transporter family protein
MLLAFIILGESITYIMVIGMLTIGIGTYLMIQKKQGENKASASNKWLIYAMLSAVFASLTAILGKIGITNIESNLGTAIRTIVVLIMAWVVVFATKKQSTVKNTRRKDLLFICLSGIATGASWLCYYKALQTGPASVVVPIDKLSIVITIAFSFFVFREKLTKKALVGLTLVVAGTLALLIKYG